MEGGGGGGGFNQCNNGYTFKYFFLDDHQLYHFLLLHKSCGKTIQINIFPIVVVSILCLISDLLNQIRS